MSLIDSFFCLQGDSGGPVITGGAGTSSVLVAVNSFVKPGVITTACGYLGVAGDTSIGESSSGPGNKTAKAALSRFWNFIVNFFRTQEHHEEAMVAVTENVRQTDIIKDKTEEATPIMRRARQGSLQCRIDVPSVGTRVSSYIEWIQTAMTYLDSTTPTSS
jgi:hypothetical protein